MIALRTEVATAVAAALQLKPSEEQKMRVWRGLPATTRLLRPAGGS